MHEYGVELVPWEQLPKAAAIVAAVAHRGFKARPVSDYVDKLAPNGVLTDVKSQFDAPALAAQGVTVWRL
jgi:UDP-N-acetyl-D-galactosamine dehydrogenase